MKHFLALVVLAIALYIGWTLLPRPERTRMRRVCRKHIKAIAAIVLVLLAGLVYAFYTRSINLL